MYPIIPLQLKNLAQALGGNLYVVGGACRDFIAGLKSQKRDWDICSPLGAEEICAAAQKVGMGVDATYKNTGTVRLSFGEECAEFTRFRTDKYVRGTHTPQEVFFTDDIALDARRRDFKCNAVYYDILLQKFVDPLGGIADIKNKTLSTVADADKVFGEDGLRLMRLCRIAAQTGFTPEKDCVAGAVKNVNLIKDIAAERVWAELEQILLADVKYGICGGQYAGLKLMERINLIKILLPELALGKGMAQNPAFHNHDVLEHSLRCVLYAQREVRLAALLHDIGKPYCLINYGKYAMHETEGERIAADICARLKVPKKLAAETCRLVKLHMYDLNLAARENKVRKFIVNNLQLFDKLLLIKQADFSACKDDLSPAPCVIKWQKIYTDMQKEGVPLTLKQLKIKGNNLIDAGISPDEVGKTLNFLLEQCAMGTIANDRQKLLISAKNYVRQMR